MSVTDQAFIRAYQVDVTSKSVASKTVAPGASIQVGLGSVIPPPHANFGGGKFRPPIAPVQRAALPTTSNTQTAATAGNSAASSIVRPHFATGKANMASLSSFTDGAAQQTAVVETLKPALEIDGVRWPAICETLLAQHAEVFDPLVTELKREAELGLNVTAFSGTKRREGRTTLALCLARRLARRDLKVALVDADFAHPQLAAQLSIGLQRGWEAVLGGEETLWDVMIESVADRLALAPLGASLAGDDVPLALYRIAGVLAELAEHFDVVLVDAGSLGEESAAPQWLLEPNLGIHNIVLTHDARSGSAPQLATACLQLADAGQRQLGIVEMFGGQ
ncbi:MAG TPA: hypothetical protein VGJ15_03510 [Pirellulales bacterium]